MNKPMFNGSLADYTINTNVLAMISPQIMSEKNVMPLSYNETNNILTVVTPNYNEIFREQTILTELLKEFNDQLAGLNIVGIEFNNFTSGYSAHYHQQFISGNGTKSNREIYKINMDTVTSEQTKLAREILQKGVEAGASDIHIEPGATGARVRFRIDGRVQGSSIPTLSISDEVMVCNIYKRNAGLEVSNLVAQSGRFSMYGKDFRFESTPYGDSGIRNTIVLRIIGSSDEITSLDNLNFKKEETEQIRDLLYEPNGIILVCGPTGEGKSTTLYSCIKELADSDNYVIDTVEDPIEKYIDGISQSQYHYAEVERNSYTFAKAIRSFLRADPDVIMVGEIRDKETALTAIQASQTGHLIFSTLHVRNSISVFKRLYDMGVNVSGFTEQTAGIISQRLLALNCPHCRKRVVSKLNRKLRKKDLLMLKQGEDEQGNKGYITYKSVGCERCHLTGIVSRKPILEIIPFNDYMRDYFCERHGLVEIEKYLRKHNGFRSLWDKGMELVATGEVSLEELLSRLPVDTEFDD